MRPGPVVRVGLWLALVVLASAAAYRGSWAQVLQVIAHPAQVVDEHLVHSWGILTVCLLALAIKAPEVVRAVRTGPGGGWPRLTWAVVGLGCLAGSPMLFEPAPLFVGAVGLWALLLGRAARWPAVLLGIYLIGAGFPLVAESAGAGVFEAATVAPTYGALQALSIPVSRAGAELTITDPAGQPLGVVVTAACAAPATIGVFLALFAWMVLDVPLPPRWLGALFLVGLAGTYLQNVGRVIGLLLVGHAQGASALWAAHADAGYPMFIAWYAFFAVAYFCVATRTRAPAHAAARSSPG